MARWSAREVTELNALFTIDEEDQREINPEHMSDAERLSYLRGQADARKPQ